MTAENAPQRIVVEADDLLGPPSPPPPQAPPSGQPLSPLGFGLGRPAPLPRRYTADLIDSLIVSAPLLAVLIALNLGAGLGVKSVVGLFILFLIVILLTPVINVAYRVSMMMRPGAGNGQTLGREILSVRVKMIDGDQVTGGDALVREIVWKDIVIGTLGALLLGIPLLLDLLSPLWHPQRRAWHDRLAGTVVVDARTATLPGRPLAAAPPVGEPLALAPPDGVR